MHDDPLHVEQESHPETHSPFEQTVQPQQPPQQYESGTQRDSALHQ